MPDAIKSTTTPSVHGLVVLNPDGTNISGGSGGGLTDAELRATPVPVSGSLTVDTTGLATSAKQDTGNASLATIAGAVDANEMQVDVISMPTTNVAQSGSWTVVADAGTNLNTSALALETGGNLATIAGKDFATQTTLAAINTKLVSGTDIGDVTINNTTSNPVPVQPPASGYLNIAIDQTGNNNAVDVLTISAGDNNIGNVDIVTMPNVTIGSALPAGTNAIGKLSANSGVDIGDVDVTSISAGSNLIGDVDIQPRSTGGWSVANFTSGDTYTALTNTAQVIKASAGKFGGYYIYNPNSSATYVMIYDIAAASVTVGTSTAKLVFCIPATAGANLELLAGIPFSTAMSIAAATTGGGNSAPATALEAMVFYK